MQRWERIAKRVDTETTPRQTFTKTEIAQWLNLSRPALNRRLKGEVGWGYDELESLAGLFGTTVEELAGENHVNGTSVTEE